MALEYTYPELSLGLKLIRINMPDLAAYLSDPTTVCTLFASSYEVWVWLRSFVFFCGFNHYLRGTWVVLDRTCHTLDTGKKSGTGGSDTRQGGSYELHP